VGKPLRRKPFENSRRRSYKEERIIKINIKKTWFGNMDWFELAQVQIVTLHNSFSILIHQRLALLKAYFTFIYGLLDEAVIFHIP
jgi:hypothetical protein